LHLEANLAENHREAEVLFAEGDYIEALVQSRKSNLGHGLPYTRTEWRQAVMDIVKIRHPRSNAWIAREIGCSPVTVGRVRVELEEAGEIPVLEYLEAENGRMVHRQARDEKNDPSEVAEAEAELPEEIAAEEMAEEEEVEETEAGRKASQEGKAQESPEQGEDISEPECEPDPGDPIKMALKLARLGEPLAVEVGLWLEGEQHPILTTLLIATNPPKGFEEAAPEYDNCLIITEALARRLNLIFN
jgi:hypothetical protein